MKNTWQLQEAKSKFSKLVDQAMELGPQIVTKRGVDSVVILSVKEYKKIKKQKNSLVSFFRNATHVDLDIERSKDTGRPIDL